MHRSWHPPTTPGPPPGAARPLRRTARAAGARGTRRVPGVPVVGRPGLRGGRRRRPRHARSRPGLGARRPRRPRRPGARGSGRCPARRWPRDRAGPRPDPRRHPRLVLRRLPRRLAVLRRPDVFHAAVAGAPVTDWPLYDTHYTERYLGDPDRRADGLRALLVAHPTRPKLTRPLLLVHGLADDNVVAAHTLQLSAALLAAGRPHQVLPLTGRHAHGPAGGGRREPAAAPARLPAHRLRPAVARSAPPERGADKWAGKDSNLRRHADGFTASSLWPLGHRPGTGEDIGQLTMPPCPVSTSSPRSTSRRSATPSIRQPRGRHPLRLQGHRQHHRARRRRDQAALPTEDRLKALRQVLEEKLVRRKVSLKALDYGKVEEASGGTVRQT